MAKTNDTEMEITFCKSMIGSVLAYGDYTSPKEEIIKNSYLQEYAKKLGEEKVLELIEIAQNNIEKINHNVYTDGEGCTYNSIVWKDEKLGEEY